MSDFTIDERNNSAEILTAHEALRCCLEKIGRVDLNIIASLTNLTQQETLSLLKGVIYYDPERNEFVTADEYLSGNIFLKIKYAEAAIEQKKEPPFVNLNENISALKIVMPKRITSKQIKVTIGSPWIPVEIYRDFIIALIGIKSPSGKIGLQVEYVRPANHYIIKGKRLFSEFTRAKLTYGTSEMNAFEIIERLLNSRELIVYETYVSFETRKKTRKINKAETLLVQEKARQISERFNYWLFKDETRCRKIVDLYNEKFCAIVPRRFNGSPMLLPGKNPEIQLQEYQLNAIRRTINSKNILLAHQVGAGKTYVMAAAAMEMRRLGISKRNLFVVPNNILEQWNLEFKNLYPDASILVIEPRQFSPARRNRILKHIIESDYDAIIMTYTSFALIPISREERERELMKAHNTIIEAMQNSVDTDAYCVLNRQSAKISHKLKLLWESEQSSTYGNVYFDDLNVNTLFVDEAHNFKNITIDTKHSSLPGLNTKGSKRCDDMLTKIRLVQRNNNGRGVVFATGTPVTNSVSDIYTIQKYLGYEILENLNLAEFDNWIKMFSEITEEFEVEANGVEYRLRKRLSKYYNLPELSLMLADIADMYFTSGDDSKLPSYVETVNCIVQSGDALKDYIAQLAERADKVKAGVIPRTEDNMLKITTDGRKAALDMRLVDSDAADESNSKLNYCVKNVTSIWESTERLTQLIFLDQSTPKDSFNLYDDIKYKLINNGIPAEEIAFVHDAVTDSTRTALFGKVRKGKIRILIGSTSKLGIGSNVQNYLVAIHHLDIPWRPSDVTQREGRMLRQGNKNENVKIYRYITNGSFDAYSWQILENKQRFISQIICGSYTNRTGDEVDEAVLTYSEVKSLAVGNPLIKHKIELETLLQRKLMLYSRIQHRKLEANEILLQLPSKRAELNRLQSMFAEDYSILEKEPKSFTMQIMGETFRKRRDAGERLIELLAEYAFLREDKLIGAYRGFQLFIANNLIDARRVFLLKGTGCYKSELSESAMGIVARMDNCLNSLSSKLNETVIKLQKLETDEHELIDEINKTSEIDDQIVEIRKKLKIVNKQLGM